MKQLKKTLLTLVALLAVTTGAWAQTDVSTFAELQTALSAGNNVKLTANIQFTSAIEISGSKKILIDGNGKKMSGPSTCAFIISSDNTLAIKNATIDNFDRDKGGGAIRNEGTLVLDGCTVSNNHTDGSNQGGGAIENQGTLYASNTTFSGNYSSEIGGAINNYRGNLYLSGCTFTNNYTTSSNAYYGGAIGNNSTKTLVLVNCTFSGNKYGGSTGTANDLGIYSTPGTYTIAGCTGIVIAGATLTTYQYGTATLDYSDLSAISFTYDQSDTPIPAATPVPITWDATTKTASIEAMPAGNVTVSVEYFPQATAEGAVTAATGVKATTEDALVTIDETKLTGVAKMMYYVSADAEATAPAYDAEGWTDKVPTAENYTQAADLKVWYYPVGTDEGVDEATATYSDGDMNATALAVSLGDAPTYDVTLNAEGLSTDEAAAWKVAKGTDTPAAFPLEGVKKGETVTVTYSGTRKVIGVKAEKKATKLTITIPATENAAALTLDVTGCTTWEQILNQNVTTLDYEGDGVYGQTSNCYILDGNNNRLNLNTPYDPTTNYHWGTQR